jgi:FkbH-like protein
LEYNFRVVRQIDSVKLVIFDLDDTLWRGLIGEHYGDDADRRPVWVGWPLGVHEAIQHLKARGILVAACSKNNLDVVKTRWNRPIPLEWITLDDFVSTEIGWGSKAEGVARILNEVNLTSRNVVFVDDNPVEREAVKSAFPDIRVMGANPFHTRRILLNASETQVPILTAESAVRDTMVRRQKERECERKNMSRDEFLRNLNCRVQLHQVSGVNDAKFDRTLELLNKTNQFNTSGKRWPIGEIDGHLKVGGQIVVFTVADKFTSYGLVGVVLLLNNEFQQLVMSCRILGLDVETGVVKMIVRDMRERGVMGPIVASIVETEPNIVCRDVFVRAGFRNAGGGVFSCDGNDLGDPSTHLSIVWGGS